MSASSATRPRFELTGFISESEVYTLPELKRRLARHDRRGLEAMQNSQESMFDGYRTIHREIKRKHGHTRAEAYARRVGRVAIPGTGA